MFSENVKSMPEDCESTEVPQREFSDRMKEILKKLGYIEENMNQTLFNVSLVKYVSDSFPEPECHLQCLDAIEQRLYNMIELSSHLHNSIK